MPNCIELLYGMYGCGGGGLRNHTLKIRTCCHGLFFIMGCLVQVKQHLYIEMISLVLTLLDWFILVFSGDEFQQTVNLTHYCPA